MASTCSTITANRTSQRIACAAEIALATGAGQSRSAVPHRRYRWRRKVRSASRREAARAETATTQPPAGLCPTWRSGSRRSAVPQMLHDRPRARRESEKIAPSRCQRIPTAAGTAAKRATRRRSVRAKPSSLTATSHKPPRPAPRPASERAGWARPKRERYGTLCSSQGWTLDHCPTGAKHRPADPWRATGRGRRLDSIPSRDLHRPPSRGQ